MREVQIGQYDAANCRGCMFFDGDGCAVDTGDFVAVLGFDAETSSFTCGCREEERDPASLYELYEATGDT